MKMIIQKRERDTIEIFDERRLYQGNCEKKKKKLCENHNFQPSQFKI